MPDDGFVGLFEVLIDRAIFFTAAVKGVSWSQCMKAHVQCIVLSMYRAMYRAMGISTCTI